MSHTHTNWFWHTHMHVHSFGDKGFDHDEGHYHEWINTHDHGKGISQPHSHAVKFLDHDDDKHTVHHHRIDDHTVQEEDEDQVMHAPIRYRPTVDVTRDERVDPSAPAFNVKLKTVYDKEESDEN